MSERILRARDDSRSLRSAFASICRMRSRVTAKRSPTSDSVWSLFSAMPKRNFKIFRFARRERAEQALDVRAEIAVQGHLERRDGLRIAHEVSEHAVAVSVADRALKTERLFRDLLHVLDDRQRDAHRVSPVRRAWAHGRIRARKRDSRARASCSPRPCAPERESIALLRKRARDGLPNPPRRIGAELVAPSVFELVDAPHEADVALLNQVEKHETAVSVLVGNAHHEPQIGGNELRFGGIGETLALFDFGARSLQLLSRAPARTGACPRRR